MTRKLALMTALVALAATPAFAQKQRLSVVDANGNLDALIWQHAAANNLPEDLVHRVIKRESGGNPRVVSAGNYGLMQIKLRRPARWDTPAMPLVCSMPTRT